MRPGRDGDRDHLRLVATEAMSIAGRLPPFDLDAEAAVLSASILHRPALDRALGILRPAMFYSDSNNRIFAACATLRSRGEPTDVVTVTTCLRDSGRLVAVGGMAYIAQIADSTPAVANVEAHARTVRRKFQMRRLIATCQKIAAEGYGDIEELEEFMLGVERAVFEVTRAFRDERSVSLREALLFGLGALRETSETPGKLSGLSTGLANLDELTAGLHAKEVTLLGAETGGGKTALATQIGINVADTSAAAANAEERRGVLMFSLEMPKEQYAQRIAASEGRVDLQQMRLGRGTSSEWGRLHSAQATLSALPIEIDDSPSLSLSELRGRVEAAAVRLLDQQGAPLRLVVIDYFQLMDFEDQRGSNKEQQLNSLMRGIKTFAGSLPGVAFLVLVQLNDDGKVRDCTAAEMHSDGMWVIEIDARAERKPRFDGDQIVWEPETARVRMRKQRMGRKRAAADLWWFDKFTRFENGGGDP